jgi:quinone-modifying oxidoreductase subunit QmoC
MSEAIMLDPDVGFIKDVCALGGGDLKKCYQCATCSVVCPIAPENKPFPRKEMIAASWGIKDKLVSNADIWLCHNCGDCTTRCPRGAKPGDVLGAVRAYAVQDYAGPKGLGKLVRDKSKLPVLLAIPAVIILVVGFLSNMVGLNWLNFSPTEGHAIWQSSYINNYLVDIIMIPTFFFAVGTFALGLKRFIADMHANALAEGKTRQEKIDPAGFVQALIKVIPTIFKHNKFNECTENKERSTAHMMVLYSFIGLFIVTNCFFIAEWILHIEGPYSQINPIKWLGNIAGIALIVGGLLMWKNRLAKKDSVSSYWDWYLVGLVLALGITGLGTELLRLGGFYNLMALVYFIHLIAIWCLFFFTPFSKLAHLVYRTTAMAYAEYSGRGF